MELSKSDKRIARIIIEKGLVVELEKGLNKAEKILKDWKQGKGNTLDSYHALYKHITNFDDKIERRYDNTRNGDLMFIIVHQLYEKLIDKEEIKAFSEEGQAIIETILSLRDR